MSATLAVVTSIDEDLKRDSRTCTEAENLARHIIARMESVTAKLKSLEDDIRKLWVEFDKLKAGETTIPCRTNMVFAEPTLCISTAKSAKAGSHFDIICPDDLVNEINATKPGQLETVYQAWLALIPLLEVTGYVLMSGTVYSYDDVYARVQEQAQNAGLISTWQINVHDCWSFGCTNCPHTNLYHDFNINIAEAPCGVEGCTCIGFHSDEVKGVLFPQFTAKDGRKLGHTVEFLEYKRDHELGPVAFANQYECRPLSEESQTFDEVLIGGASMPPTDPRMVAAKNQGWRFIVGDLSYSENEKRDLSVFYLCRKYQGKLYAIQCLSGHFGSDELCATILKLIWNERPGAMYLEKTLGTTFLQSLLTAEAKKQGLQHLPIQWVDASRQKNAKEIRIRGIRGMLVNQNLWLNSEMDHYPELVKQLVKFPRYHDDYADALGQAIEVPTQWQNEQTTQVTTGQQWVKWYLNLHDKPPEDDGGGNAMGNIRATNTIRTASERERKTPIVIGISTSVATESVPQMHFHLQANWRQ